MNPRIAIVLTAAGPIMGTLRVVADGYEIDDPRAIQVQPVGNGSARIGFAECVGQPKTLYLPADTTHYIPTQKALVDGYLQARSGLAIASSLPITRDRRDT